MSKGTERHAIRVARPVWDAALAAARERGETLNEVIRRFLIEYANQKDQS